MTALSYMEDKQLGGVTQSLDGPVKEKKRPRRFARPWISEGGHAQDERDLRVTDDSKQSLVFRVCSYNVLAQSLVEKNPKLYVHCSPEYMLWTYRRSLLLEELLDLDSDVSIFGSSESLTSATITLYFPWNSLTSNWSLCESVLYRRFFCSEGYLPAGG